ncbi:hypothetical protein [Paenibacillus sp. FSL K6-2859]|uniref:hypothetical protein n=1 Tax=Paenibacillus sp. FSL K6-2859 TaxID=2921482 RepID=UPI0030F8C3E6
MVDKRVQLMYINGRVSFLDVLFRATSFGLLKSAGCDFTYRVQDQSILAELQKTKNE